MHKKKLYHAWMKIRPIKPLYLFAPFIIMAAISVFALRQNNLKMVELRNNVYAADEKGGDVEKALQELRTYVHGHMNTSLTSGNNSVYPPIQLKYTYQRMQKAEQERVKGESARIYTDAQNYCEKQNSTDFSGRNRVPCIEQYVSQHTVSTASVPDALYKFNFASPRWSPDVAGFSLALAVLLFLLFAVRAVLGKLLKRLSE